jgi:hypothetical protein
MQICALHWRIYTISILIIAHLIDAIRHDNFRGFALYWGVPPAGESMNRQE